MWVSAIPSRTITSVSSHGVALAGFYGHGNFGDDLMAIIFGRHLQALGVPFRIYRLCTPYAAPFDLPVAHTIDELLEGADTLIWGGGGLLVPWDARRFERSFPGVAEEFATLVATAKRRGMRLLAASVGGSEYNDASLSPAYKADFVAAAESITVRNRGDCAHLSALGYKAEYFPDVVWQTATHFPLTPTRGPGLRIGLDLYAENLQRRHALYLLPLIQLLIWRRSDCRFIFLNSRNASQSGEQRLGRLFFGNNVQHYRFQHPADDIATLASLDLLLSTRLHTPMVALQYHVPVLSLFGEGKTRLLCSELGLMEYAYTHRDVPHLFSLLASRRRLDCFLSNYRFPELAVLAGGSRGHLDRLTQLLNPGNIARLTTPAEESLSPAVNQDQQEHARPRLHRESS